MIETLSIQTQGPGLVNFTRQVSSLVQGAGLEEGLCTVFVQHTSASLIIQENADPSVQDDLENFLKRLVPENDPLYTHTAEGPDDMPAHIRSALTQTSIGIPIMNGQLVLGTWQGLYLWEHRHRPHRRQVVVHIA
jgi:secondary thiamine-phosphate synthase enzyme